MWLGGHRHVVSKIVNVSQAAPTDQIDQKKHLFYGLPLKNKKLLKVWIHKIGRKNLPINRNSRVCSDYFIHGLNSYPMNTQY